MATQPTKIRWQRIALTVGIGFLSILAATTIYDAWRKRNGWCVQSDPNGKQKILYGADCQRF